MITKIHITNFRSIKDAELNLDVLNVLIGANGAGKSTLLEALNFTKRISSGVSIADAARTYAPFGRDFFNYYSDGYIANFSFDIQTKTDSKYQYNFSIGYNPDFSAHEDFYVYSEKLSKYGDSSSSVIFDRNPASNKISFDAGSGVNQLPIEIENNRLFIATLAHPDAREIVDTVSSYEIIWSDERYDNPKQTKVVVDNPFSTDTVDDVAVALSLKDKIRYNAAIDTIKKVITEFESPEIIDLSEASTKNDNNKRPENDKSKKAKEYRYVVNWRDSRHPDNMYSRFAISGGNIRVIYLILSLYNTESRSCFVAEEIENGMHPGRVKKLVQVLMSIAKKGNFNWSLLLITIY